MSPLATLIETRFPGLLNPICSCNQDIEKSTHFLVHCSNYSNEGLTFLNIIRNIVTSLLDKNDLEVTESLLYEDS